MNISAIIQSAITLVRPFIPLGAKAAHEATQRAVTLPRRDHDRLAAGMSDADKVEALRLRDAAADANADYIVFMASRGEIDAD